MHRHNNQITKPRRSVGAFKMDMERIINIIEDINKNKSLLIIGIDGPCASGKTTLAAKLAKELGAQVIHTDDFFLPFEMKTSERLSQPGGNIHYERFCREVAKGIATGKEFEYGVYRCSDGMIAEKKTVIPEGIIIAEGSYSLNPSMGVDYDLRVFVEAPLEVRLERILERNGREKLEVFKEKWIPMENKYFDCFGIKEKCDIIIEQK